MSDARSAITLRSQRDLLGMIPYLLNFHPRDSLVALFMQPDHRIRVTGRLDLAAPQAVIVDSLHQIANRDEIASVVIVGYGPRDAADTVASVARVLAARVPVTEVLLVADRYYFCLRCPCAASQGVAFDPTATASAARATIAGMVALPARTDLLALTDADLVEQAAVEAAIARLPVQADTGTAVLRHLMEQAASGHRLSPEQVARLAMLLRDTPTRDFAWRATSDLMWQRDLWLDVTRRVPDGYVPAPASLAAWCAWRRGEETLAATALQRALAADPGYSMARLLDRAVVAHIPAGEIIGTWPPAATPTTAGGRS